MIALFWCKNFQFKFTLYAYVNIQILWVEVT